MWMNREKTKQYMLQMKKRGYEFSDEETELIEKIGFYVSDASVIEELLKTMATYTGEKEQKIKELQENVAGQERLLSGMLNNVIRAREDLYVLQEQYQKAMDFIRERGLEEEYTRFKKTRAAVERRSMEWENLTK